MAEHGTILVKLINEAGDVWRPVDAEHVGGDKYRALGQIPEAEVWKLQPAGVVHCHGRDCAHSRTGLVALAPVQRDA